MSRRSSKGKKRRPQALPRLTPADRADGGKRKVAAVAATAALLAVCAAAVCAAAVWGVRALRTRRGEESASPITTVKLAPNTLAPPSEERAADASASVSIDEPVDAKILLGRWARTDYPYVIDIASVRPNGALAAAYYNPRPIHVARAESRQRHGALTVFVELQDVNYPGSTYTLRYDPHNDTLRGVYYQALEGQSFDIEFDRVPAGD